MAIGASASRVLSEVLGQRALLVAVGLGSGALAALLLGRFMAGFLFQVDATDPAAFAIACGSLTLVALLACVVPAWRAARTNRRARCERSERVCCVWVALLTS